MTNPRTEVSEAPQTWNRYYYQCKNDEDHTDSIVMLGDERPPITINCYACRGQRHDAMQITSKDIERWGGVYTG